jgi:carboxymethylenebutenolidase
VDVPLARRLRPLPRLALVAALLLAVAGCGPGDDATTSDGADSTYADDMAEQHDGDAPTPSFVTREPTMPVEASAVDYATTDEGTPVTGYVAVPTRPDSVLDARGMDPETDRLPAVIVVHEWWGLNDNVKSATRRLAGEGYRALAVDLYRGEVAETPARARELMELAMQTPEEAVANLQAAYRSLSDEAPRVAVMGWCFGGSMTLNAALAMPEEFDAAVIYYGRVQTAEEDALADLEMPVMGHFGAEDGSIPVGEVEAFRQMLGDAGVEHEVFVYQDAGHAFANPSGQNFVPEAAMQAWDRTTRFLLANLYPDAPPSAGEQRDPLGGTASE